VLFYHTGRPISPISPKQSRFHLSRAERRRPREGVADFHCGIDAEGAEQARRQVVRRNRPVGGVAVSPEGVAGVYDFADRDNVKGSAAIRGACAGCKRRRSFFRQRCG
jgi:hypothetical protein